MPPHPLTNFVKQKYYQNEPKLDRVCSKNNLPKIKDGTYIVNLDGHESVGAHWIALSVNGDKLTHFDSFGVEHIQKEIKKFIGNKNIITNIYRIQAYNSIVCGCFGNRFIDSMLKGKCLLEYTKLFSPNKYKNNDKIQNNIKMLSIESKKVKMIKIYCTVCDE